MNKAKKEILRKFRKKNFAKLKKIRTFAAQDNEEPTALAYTDFTDDEEPTALAYTDFTDDEEPTALAYTDFSKPMPILEGEVAERFIRIMEENSRKAAEKAKLPPTKEELERELSYSKIMLNFQEHEVEQLKNKISQLEEKIKDLANGKTEEE